MAPTTRLGDPEQCFLPEDRHIWQPHSRTAATLTPDSIIFDIEGLGVDGLTWWQPRESPKTDIGCGTPPKAAGPQCRAVRSLSDSRFRCHASREYYGYSQTAPKNTGPHLSVYNQPSITSSRAFVSLSFIINKYIHITKQRLPTTINESLKLYSQSTLIKHYQHVCTTCRRRH